MQLPTNRTSEQDAALVECLRMFAAHGRALRLRERAEQKCESAGLLGERSADSRAGANGTAVCAEMDVPNAKSF